MAASFVSPANILDLFFFLSFFFVRITEPVLEVLIYFPCEGPHTGECWIPRQQLAVRIRLKWPWAPSVP